MKKDYRKFLLICIVSQALFFSFSKASEGPARLSYMEKSVWGYEYIHEGQGNRGTGVFTGENLFVTNFHVLLGSASSGPLLKEEKAIQNISLSQEGNPSVLRVKRILHISAMHDLALLEIEGKVSNYLSFAENPLRPNEDLFVLAYHGGGLKGIKSAGSGFYENDYFYSFPVNHSYSFSGASGSPVLSDQGHIAGIIFEAIGNTLGAIKLNYLKSFAKGETGLSCLGFADTGHCLQAELENLKSQASNGNAQAQYMLAYRHYQDLGTGQDTEQAFQWWKKAAEQGYAPAQNRLALMYYNGEGTEQDPEQAVYWWKKAAKQNYVPAQYRLAERNYNGEGTEQDRELAFQWFQRAAKQNYVPAQYRLAEMYYNGEGTEQDRELAFQWFQRAAKQNYGPAQHRLAEMYYNGEGTEQDRELAFQWFQRAAKQQAHALAQIIGGVGLRP